MNSETVPPEALDDVQRLLYEMQPALVPIYAQWLGHNPDLEQASMVLATAFMRHAARCAIAAKAGKDPFVCLAKEQLEIAKREMG